MKTASHSRNNHHFSVFEFFLKLLNHKNLFLKKQPTSTKRSSDNEEQKFFKNSKEKELEEKNTQLQSLYDKVQSSNSSLILQNHHKSEFLASVAHELKNQIGAIISLSEFIKSDNLEVIAELEEGKEEKTNQRSSSKQKLIEAAELASDINNVASDLLEFARDLMDVHQAESGDFSVNMAEEIDIIHVIKRAIKVNYDFSLRRRIAIEFDEKETIKEFLGSEAVRNFDISSTPSNLNSSTATTLFPKIKLDQRRMKQILINLLSNSLKYSNERTRIRISLKVIAADQDFGQNISTPHPNPLPLRERVRVRGNESNNYLQITITDQGFGMTKEQIELALKKHQKIENENSEKFDSFGLGLPMVKRLVELQKGTLDIRSEAGKGSEFMLRFPF